MIKLKSIQKNMKLEIQQDQIALALNIVHKAINHTNTLPILGNILLEAKNNKLYFTATNLEIAIKYNTPAVIHEEGSITVPSKIISNYITLLPNENLNITLLEDLSLEIKSKKSKTKIKCLSAEDYPTIPEVLEENSTQVNLKTFEKAINETVFSCSLNNSRPFLSGVFVKLSPEEAILVATDSHRLSEVKIKTQNTKLTPEEESSHCIIPAKTILELSKILNGLPEVKHLNFYFSKNQIVFNIENIILTSRLIEANFPDYNQIIPKEHKTLVKINTNELSLALKRVSLFVKELNNAIYLNFDTENKKLVIYSEETKIGEENSEIDIEITGDNNNISINSQYLSEVLSVIDEEFVFIEINEKHSPVKLKPEHDTNFIYIIMPLKI